MNKTNIFDIHNEAMDLAQKGDDQKRCGNQEEAKALYTAAYEKEREAALMADETNSSVLGQAILLRSAATLAQRSELFSEAEQLITMALVKDIPESMTHELRELHKEVSKQSQNQISGSDIYEVNIPHINSSKLHQMISSLGGSIRLGHIAVL